MSIFSLKQNSSIISNLDSRYSPILHKHSELAPVIIPTFTRSSVAYKSDGTQVASGQPRFETVSGRTGVLIEEWTTNLLLYSENFTQSAWDKTNVTVTPAGTYLNFPVTRFTPTGAGYAQVSQTFLASGAANRTFTWSFWARGQTARTFHVTFYGGVSGTFQSYAINLDTNWKKFTITHTFPAIATSARIQWGNVSPFWGADYTDWIEVAGVQVEEKPYATSYVKTTSSTATRASETLTVPTAGVLSPTEGTVEVWVYWPDFLSANVSSWRRVWGVKLTEGPGMFVCHWHPEKPDKLLFALYSDDGTRYEVSVDMPSVGWHKIDCAWSPTRMALFVDGEKVAERTDHVLPTVLGDSTIHVGARHDSRDHLNTIIGPVRFSNIARSDAEIAAAYNSGKPLPWDEYTTALFTFDGYLDTGPRAGSYRILHEGTNQTVIPKKAVILDTNTRTVTLSYDSNGRLTSVTEKDGSTTVKTTSLSYDANGNLTQIQESAGNIVVTTQFSYNTNGQLVSISRSVT